MEVSVPLVAKEDGPDERAQQPLVVLPLLVALNIFDDVTLDNCRPASLARPN